LTDTFTFDIHQAESVLRLCVALFGGFEEFSPRPLSTHGGVGRAASRPLRPRSGKNAPSVAFSVVFHPQHSMSTVWARASAAICSVDRAVVE